MFKCVVILAIVCVGTFGVDLQANVGIIRSGTCPSVCADPLPLRQLLRDRILYEVASSSNNNRRCYQCDVNRITPRSQVSVCWEERFYDVSTRCVQEYRYIVSNGPNVLTVSGDYNAQCVPIYNANCLIVLYCCNQMECDLYEERVYAFSTKKIISCEEFEIIEAVLAKNNICAPILPTIQNATYCSQVCF